MDRLRRLLRARVGRVPVAVVAASTILVLTSSAIIVAVTLGADPVAGAADGSSTPRPPASPTAASPTATADRSPSDPSASPAPSSAGPVQDGPPITLTNPAPGTGEWQYAGAGPTFGTGGGLLTYRVAVEVGLPVSVGDVAAVVDASLGDPRGWTGRGERRFQRVSGSSAASFTVYLASPWTAYSLCSSVVDIRIGGVPYTNCQAGGRIVVNSDRYLYGASRFTGSLDVYRRYVINHEIGHRLGRGHLNCPGHGRLAPVMQQQTLGMQGCQPNAWPYPEIPVPTTDPATTDPATTGPATTEPPTTGPATTDTATTGPPTTGTQTTTTGPAPGPTTATTPPDEETTPPQP